MEPTNRVRIIRTQPTEKTMTNANNNGGSRIALSMTARLRGNASKNANLTAHLNRTCRKLQRFTPTVNGDERVAFVDDILSRCQIVVAPADWMDEAAQDPPENLEAVVVRVSNSVALLWWPDEYVFLTIDGVASIAVGAVVCIRRRTVETQKMKAATRLEARWLYSEIDANVQVVSRDGENIPMGMRPTYPVFPINAAFYQTEVIRPGTVGR